MGGKICEKIGEKIDGNIGENIGGKVGGKLRKSKSVTEGPMDRPTSDMCRC